MCVLLVFFILIPHFVWPSCKHIRLCFHSLLVVCIMCRFYQFTISSSMERAHAICDIKRSSSATPTNEMSYQYTESGSSSWAKTAYYNLFTLQYLDEGQQLLLLLLIASRK